ncbi:hypothetical protein V8C86DRAFT_807174 [Haematococcus lacustris]
MARATGRCDVDAIRVSVSVKLSIVDLWAERAMLSCRLRPCPRKVYARAEANTQARAGVSVQVTCPNASLFAVVKAHPSVVKRGEVTLECDDGGLSVLRDVFVVSSPWMADLLGKNCTSVKVSGSTKEEWLLVISQLYPIVPRPELSLQQLQQVLPVVHKYNFSELLQFVSSRLATRLPSSWSLDPSAPGYIIKWLVTSEQLQLDALKQAALEGLKTQAFLQIRTQMETKALDADLLRLSPELMLEAWRVSLQSFCTQCTQNCTCGSAYRIHYRHSQYSSSMCSACGQRQRCGHCGSYYSLAAA